MAVWQRRRQDKGCQLHRDAHSQGCETESCALAAPGFAGDGIKSDARRAGINKDEVPAENRHASDGHRQTAQAERSDKDSGNCQKVCHVMSHMGLFGRRRRPEPALPRALRTFMRARARLRCDGINRDTSPNHADRATADGCDTRIEDDYRSSNPTGRYRTGRDDCGHSNGRCRP